MMAESIIEVADDFWNFRGSYKVAGLLEVGTHASLVRRASGTYVLLDAWSFTDEQAAFIDDLTDDGDAIEAVLNLHPFHTLHVESSFARYPHCQWFGTARHRARFPDLPWAPGSTEDRQVQRQFADDLEFSVPRGVDFISADEHVHFSSVLALHRASGTIHSDDTLNYVPRGSALSWIGMGDTLSFHPTLAKALEKRSGAAQAFRDWATTLIDDWQDAVNLCAAHSATLLDRDNHGAPLHERLVAAFSKTERTLARHERRYV